MNEQTESTSLVVQIPDVETTMIQEKKLQAFMSGLTKALVKDVHYGKIPGVKKPLLFKAGMQRVANYFNCSPDFEILEKTERWDGDVKNKRPFFRYLVRCRLMNRASGNLYSEGLGECNSNESKYKYRWIGVSGLQKEYQELFKAKKTNEIPFKFRWGRSKENKPIPQFQIYNDDIESIVNTILKMAIKRALGSAVDYLCSISDFYEIGENYDDDVKSDPTPKDVETPKKKNDQKKEGQKEGKMDLSEPTNQDIEDALNKAKENKTST